MCVCGCVCVGSGVCVCVHVCRYRTVAADTPKQFKLRNTRSKTSQTSCIGLLARASDFWQCVRSPCECLQPRLAVTGGRNMRNSDQVARKKERGVGGREHRRRCFMLLPWVEAPDNRLCRLLTPFPNNFPRPSQQNLGKVIAFRSFGQK